MIQIIHSDEEWTSIIRPLLLKSSTITDEVLLCATVADWMQHESEAIVFIEEKQVSLLANYQGQVIQLSDEHNDPYSNVILAYGESSSVAEQLVTTYQKFTQVIRIEQPSRIEKSIDLIVGYSNDEIAHEFARCISELTNHEELKIAIVNLQIHPKHAQNKRTIPVTKIILQPDDPVNLYLDPFHDQNAIQYFHNSFHISEFVKLDLVYIQKISEKLSNDFNKIIFVVDDSNVPIQSLIASVANKIICVFSNRTDHEIVERCIEIHRHLTRDLKVQIDYFCYSDNWRKSLTNEVERWIIQNHYQ